MASTEYKVKGKTFTSPHTNAEAIGVLGKLVKDEQATGELPASLVKQFARKKDLSEKQWPFVHLLVWKVENGATGEHGGQRGATGGNAGNAEIPAETPASCKL